MEETSMDYQTFLLRIALEIYEVREKETDVERRKTPICYDIIESVLNCVPTLRELDGFQYPSVPHTDNRYLPPMFDALFQADATGAGQHGLPFMVDSMGRSRHTKSEGEESIMADGSRDERLFFPFMLTGHSMFCLVYWAVVPESNEDLFHFYMDHKNALDAELDNLTCANGRETFFQLRAFREMIDFKAIKRADRDFRQEVNQFKTWLRRAARR